MADDIQPSLRCGQLVHTLMLGWISNERWSNDGLIYLAFLAVAKHPEPFDELFRKKKGP